MKKGNAVLRVTDQSRMRTTTTTISEIDRRLIRLHVDHLRRTGASIRTQAQRRENLRRLAERLPVPLLEATPDHLNDWQSSLTVSLSSIATYSSHCRCFYAWAVDSGHLEHDPAYRLPRPKLPAAKPRPIPTDDFEMALACAPEPVRTWLVLGAFMGLRASEVAAIKREDFVEGIIGGKRRTLLTGIGKGSKAYRLAVPVEVMPILQPHLTGRPGPLWRNAQHRPVTGDNVSDRVSEFFRRLGMPYTMHWTRHTFGTEVQKQTGDSRQTQVLMRHESLATTQMYVEPVTSEGVRALDRLSARLSPRLHASSDRPPPRRRRKDAA